MYDPVFNVFQPLNVPVETVRFLDINANAIHGIEDKRIPAQDGLVTVMEKSYHFNNAPPAVSYKLMIDQEQPWYAKFATMLASGFKGKETQEVIGYELTKAYNSDQRAFSNDQYYIGAPIIDTRYTARP